MTEGDEPIVYQERTNLWNQDTDSSAELPTIQEEDESVDSATSPKPITVTYGNKQPMIVTYGNRGAEARDRIRAVIEQERSSSDSEEETAAEEIPNIFDEVTDEEKEFQQGMQSLEPLAILKVEQRLPGTMKF